MVFKQSKDIIIKCSYYEMKYNIDELNKLLSQNLKTLDDTFNFITNLFDTRKVFIKEIKVKDKMNLILKKSETIKEEKEIFLYFTNYPDILQELIETKEEYKNSLVELEKRMKNFEDKIQKLEEEKKNGNNSISKSQEIKHKEIEFAYSLFNSKQERKDSLQNLSNENNHTVQNVQDKITPENTKKITKHKINDVIFNIASKNEFITPNEQITNQITPLEEKKNNNNTKNPIEQIKYEFFINDISKIQKEQIKFEEKFLLIENVHDKYKNYIELKNKQNEQISSPEKLKFLEEITAKPYFQYYIDFVFASFESLKGGKYLVYSNKKFTILFYNLINSKEEEEIKIKKAHNKLITNLRYFFDEINRRDLIISIAADDNEIKVWNFEDLKCVLCLKNIYSGGCIFSAFALTKNGQNYIVTSCRTEEGETEYPIKFYDFNATYVKKIEGSNKSTIFIDNYIDNDKKYYFITGNKGYSMSYLEDKIYQTYKDENKNNILIKTHSSVRVYKEKNKLKLIDSCTDGHIRIYDFHKADLHIKIKVCEKGVYGLCLWKNNNSYNYALVGDGDCEIKMVNLTNGEIRKSLKGHKSKVCSMIQLYHPSYGECLISQGDEIILWAQESN